MALFNQLIKPIMFCESFSGSDSRCHVANATHGGLISKRTMQYIVLRKKVVESSHNCCGQYAVQTSTYCDLINPISEASNCCMRLPPSKQNESVLTLLRHGESMWNVKNLFTGCIDVPLTEKGVEEALEAGRRISSTPIDVIYTSALIRTKMTVMLAMTQHRCKKVPVIVHNEGHQGSSCGRIHSEETKMKCIPVVTAWQLNERMYGELQGFNKLEMAKIYGKEQVYKWRRTYEVSPPNGESLEVCSQRAVTYFKTQILPILQSGRHVLVTAHANSLRSIIMYLDNLTSEEVIDLELSTGVPMLYIWRDGRLTRRGSLVGSTEPSVYAYSESLAIYKKQLDGIW